MEGRSLNPAAALRSVNLAAALRAEEHVRGGAETLDDLIQATAPARRSALPTERAQPKER